MCRVVCLGLVMAAYYPKAGVARLWPYSCDVTSNPDKHCNTDSHMNESQRQMQDEFGSFTIKKDPGFPTHAVLQNTGNSGVPGENPNLCVVCMFSLESGRKLLHAQSHATRLLASACPVCM